MQGVPKKEPPKLIAYKKSRNPWVLVAMKNRKNSFVQQ